MPLLQHRRKAPDDIDEALRGQIMAACKPWMEEAKSQVTTISAAFAKGQGIAEVRTMDHDNELSIDVKAEEPVNSASCDVKSAMNLSVCGKRLEYLATKP